MDPLVQKALEARIKDCENKIEAILDAIGLECEYTPESYKLVKPQKKEDS